MGVLLDRPRDLLSGCRSGGGRGELIPPSGWDCRMPLPCPRLRFHRLAPDCALLRHAPDFGAVPKILLPVTRHAGGVAAALWLTRVGGGGISTGADNGDCRSRQTISRKENRWPWLIAVWKPDRSLIHVAARPGVQNLGHVNRVGFFCEQMVCVVQRHKAFWVLCSTINLRRVIDAHRLIQRAVEQ